MAAQTVLTVLDIFGAIAIHLWFKTHEPKSLAALFIPLTVASTSNALLWFLFLGSHFVWKAYSLYFVTLIGSITLYRISPFHPLAQFPGPISCKVSKLWTAFLSYRGTLQEYHKRLHNEYGPIVRVGPNELSVTEKEFIPLLLGSSGLPKGPLWEGRIITPSENRHNALVKLPDFESHAQLRKSWNKAFGTDPLNDYAHLLVRKARQLHDHFKALCVASNSDPCKGAHVDFAKWMNFFSLDFMGDMLLGGGFDFMGQQDKEGLWRGMESALAVGSITQHVPWFARFLMAISILNDRSSDFRIFALEQAKLRALKDFQKKDLFFHLLTATDPDSTSDPFISVSDSALTILAGSDTTATVLRNIMFYLLTFPEYYQALRKEIDENMSFAKQTPIDLDRLPAMRLLNAIIKESLRLLPALSTSIQRAPFKGSGGKVVGNIFIPEGTGVTIPPYCLHRDPRYFSPRADDFWPERWLMGKTEDKNFILDLAAFIPFSYGPANCVGKSLAMLELRYITTMLVQHFDIQFQPKFITMTKQDPSSGLHASGGPLPVVLALRRS